MVEIKTNKTFRQLQRSDKKISVFQGGARSGKTYNILIWLIIRAITTESRLTIDIVRQTLPALKASAYRDFIEILERMGLFNPDDLNKSDLIYRINNTLFQFISIDQPQKYRGRKRDILFINEANEINLESWRQLAMRTEEKIILDYNPSMEYHWIYDEVLPRDDVDFYKSTYLDNPFIPDTVKNEIERLKDIDPEYWKIYGLGERGSLKGLVFPEFSLVDSFPRGVDAGYGLDWGYTNDPTAVVKIGRIDNNLYIDEMLYQTGMTNQEIAKMLNLFGLNKNSVIFADSAEPKSIAELKLAGFKNIRPVAKGADSIVNGIMVMKQFRIHITKRSVNLIKELRNYKWLSDRDGKLMNKPIDAFNHAIDAARYYSMMVYGQQFRNRKHVII